MNPSDVTDAMVERFRSAACFEKQCCTVEESIAASVNAVLGDPTPITAEWLLARGWSKGFKSIYHLKNGSAFNVSWESGLMTISTQFLAFSFPCKTIGQLRALEIGLGITPCP